MISKCTVDYLLNWSVPFYAWLLEPFVDIVHLLPSVLNASFFGRGLPGGV
jgi:hypothetical protein